MKFPALLILGLLSVACAPPKCPRGYAQTGDVCHRCEAGKLLKGRTCVPDGDATAEAAQDDSGAPSTIDSGDQDASATALESGTQTDAEQNGEEKQCAELEICGNGRDDDCDGETDEPSPQVTEQCNSLDDNCDGLVDENLLTRQSRVDIWPQTLDRQDFSQVAMLPREKGGGWLFYGAGYSGDRDTGGHKIAVVGINPDGESAGMVSGAQDRTSGTTGFVADGDGRWIVILTRQLPADPLNDSSQSIHVQLFNAANLDFVGEYTPVKLTDRTYTTFVYPVAVSVFEAAQGAVHVLVAYGQDTGEGDGVSRLHIQALKRALTGEWSTTGAFQLFENPTALNVSMRRIPCREEWVLATTSESKADRQLRRYSPSRMNDGMIQAIPDAEMLGGLGTSHGDCESGADAEVVLAYSSSDALSRVRRWNVSSNTGDFTGAGDEIPLSTQLLGASLTKWGGRWLASGADSDGALTLVELRFQASPASQFLRLLDVDGPNPGVLGFADGNSLRGFAYGGTTALLSITGGVLIGVSNGHNSNLTNLLQAQATTRDQAAAVTYGLGCR